MIDKITVNAQSSIRIGAKKVIYFDPYKIESASCDADIIFFTHSHPDHFSPEDIRKVAKDDTLFVLPKSMKISVTDAGVPESALSIFSPEERGCIAGIYIETIPAYNIGKPMHPKKNEWLGYVITIEDTRIYVCGDSDATNEGKNVKCDIAMVPIGGFFTMNAKQAADFVNAIAPKVVIPMHYGSVVGSSKDAEVFENSVNDSIKVVIKL